MFSCGPTNSYPKSDRYEDLITLFNDWREFERPALIDGIPDYSSTALIKQKEGITEFQMRLEAIDCFGWSIPEKADWKIIQAEIKGLVFNHEILRPWANNPLFYTVIQMDEADVFSQGRHSTPHQG